MKYLALDYGLQRIGIAESFGTLAEPLLIIANDEKALMHINDLCIQKKIDMIVVGLSEQEMANKTQTFATQLEAAAHLPVVYQDETLSSAEVHRLLAERRPTGQRLERGPIDHLAAALILQRYLDEKESL